MLTVLDFTSERARMSVVARSPDGTLRLFCKGSDQALLGRLRRGTDADLLAATHGHLRRFSVQALRPARKGQYCRRLVLASSVYSQEQATLHKTDRACGLQVRLSIGCCTSQPSC